MEINALFSEELMLFQQFCCSVVGEYEQAQAHLCVRATTFYALPVPLPRQVSLPYHLELGWAMNHSKSLEQRGVLETIP